MKYLGDLIENLTYLEILNFENVEIENISYDSRLCRKGYLFVALRGQKLDAHSFIPEVIQSGCKVIICEEYPNDTSFGIFIKVKSSRQALAELSHAWTDFPTKSMKIIGVTGTNGKTTITFLLSQIIEAAGFKTGIIGTTGIYFAGGKIEASHTTPESLELCNIFQEMRAAKTDYVIMEVSSHALEQKRVFGIDFDAAIFTNLTHDHLDYHSTMENYANAKKILFDMLKSDGIAIVWGDDAYSDYMLKNTKASRVTKIGRGRASGLTISDELISLTGVSYSINDKSTNFRVKSNLIGKFNIDNTALAFACCRELGISEQVILEALRSVHGAEGRMTYRELVTGAIGVVDYAHTPDALEKALSACREILQHSENKNSRLICVFGCGGDRDKSKRPIMGNISAQLADLTVVTDDNPRTENAELIRKEIMAGIASERAGAVVEIGGRAKAIEHAVGISQKGDIILVAGKGHEKYQIIGKEKHHFDDFEELAKASDN